MSLNYEKVSQKVEGCRFHLSPLFKRFWQVKWLHTETHDPAPSWSGSEGTIKVKAPDQVYTAELFCHLLIADKEARRRYRFFVQVKQLELQDRQLFFILGVNAPDYSVSLPSRCCNKLPQAQKLVWHIVLQSKMGQQGCIPLEELRKL